jgi:hypothetical protein
VPGSWLHSLFIKYGESLFSANYRGFLGITKRRRINTGIRNSAELKPQDFWVFNNGITLLTLGKEPTKDGTKLTGISVINGAQTTGSIGSVDIGRHDIRSVKVLCRIINCSDPETISEIVKYNNTQNEITTWDQYSNDPEQKRIAGEFAQLGISYSLKRGFRVGEIDEIGIEDAAQPVLAFQGKHQDANRGKNLIFERKPLYRGAFEGKKATHILFAYTLAKAIDERRMVLKQKSDEDSLLSLEESQLILLRHLRFKTFLIAVVSRCLEGVLSRKVDIETVGFREASAKANSIHGLSAAWSPVVEAVLSFVVTQLDFTKFAARSGEDELVDEVAAPVNALLYASRSSLPFRPFLDMVQD